MAGGETNEKAGFEPLETLVIVRGPEPVLATVTILVTEVPTRTVPKSR
jgi:hypothetical protein